MWALWVSKTKAESNLNEYVNVSDFGFAKSSRNPTKFGFEFKLCHKPSR